MMLPLALAAGCSHRGEADAESALYKRFSALPETAVAQVCGFALCDTVSVDVVLLQAESDAAWEQLKEMLAVDDTTGVTSWLGDTEEPATPSSTPCGAPRRPRRCPRGSTARPRTTRWWTSCTSA